MERNDGPGDHDDYFGDFNEGFGEDSAADEVIFFPDDVDYGPEVDHPPTDTLTTRGDDLLLWVMPELTSIEVECAVLLDSSKAHRHNAAAHVIVKSLKLGVRRILDVNPQIPPYTGTTRSSTQAKEFLHKVGGLIDEAFKVRGLEWPPPMLRPPPAVTRDLLSLYAYASIGALTRELDPGEQLRKALDRIDRNASTLLENWGPLGVRAARAAAETSTGTTRSRIGMLFSGAAILISLLQGPGVAHNFSRDVAVLGGDIGDIASNITSGMSRILEDIGNDMSDAMGDIERIRTRSSDDRGVAGDIRTRPTDASEHSPKTDGSMETNFAALRFAITLLPADTLQQATGDIEAAIGNLEVLEGSLDQQAIGESARNALSQVRDAQESVLALRAQLEEWINTRGGQLH